MYLIIHCGLVLSILQACSFLEENATLIGNVEGRSRGLNNELHRALHGNNILVPEEDIGIREQDGAPQILYSDGAVLEFQDEKNVPTTVFLDYYPSVSESCQSRFQYCYGENITSTRLLDKYTKGDICLGVHTNKSCLMSTNIQIVHGNCSKRHQRDIEDFLCEDYDITQLQIPIIDEQCQFRYLECTTVLDTMMFVLSLEQRLHLCKHQKIFADCLQMHVQSAKFSKNDVEIINTFLCNLETDDVPDLHFEFQLFLSCYGSIYNLVSLLEDISVHIEKIVVCFKLDLSACLTDSSYGKPVPWPSYPFNCPRGDVISLDRFLCSNYSFERDGVFAISQACNMYSELKMGTTFLELSNNASQRKSTCDTVYNFSHNSCFKEEVNAIFAFLCLKPNDPIANIPFSCTYQFQFCYTTELCFGELVSPRHEEMKDKLCQDITKSSLCLKTDNFLYYNSIKSACSSGDIRVIHEFLCSHDPTVGIYNNNSLVTNSTGDAGTHVSGKPHFLVVFFVAWMVGFTF